MTATLTTERLVLRPVRLSDAAALQPRFARWEIIQHLSTQVPWPYPDDGFAQYLSDHILPAVARGDVMSWALTLKDDPHDDPIGMLEYRCNADSTDHRGFWLAIPWQGQGLMTEAVIAFQDHLFFDLGGDRLVIHNAVINQRSHRIKEKTGAELVGLVQMPHHHGDGTCERWVVTAERWRALRGR